VYERNFPWKQTKGKKNNKIQIMDYWYQQYDIIFFNGDYQPGINDITSISEIIVSHIYENYIFCTNE